MFDADPVDEWLTLAGVYNLRTYAGMRGTAVWDRVDPVLAMVIDGAAVDQCAGPGPGRGRLPHAQPPAGRPVPRRAAADHADGGRGPAAPVAGRLRDDQRDGRLQLGQVHLPVQPDPVAGGVGLRRADVGRACRSGCSWSGPSTPTWSCCGRRPRSRRRIGFDAVAPFPVASAAGLSADGHVPTPAGPGYDVTPVPPGPCRPWPGPGRLAQLVRAQPSHG